MQLAFYFFRQFLPSFFFGTGLFLFVLILDRLFDLIDLVFNKGLQLVIVLKLVALFIPTILPLTLPMAIVLGSVVTFGRLSEENELTAVQAAGIPVFKALWLPPAFALFISIFMVPFNTHIAPWANRTFRSLYEQIGQQEPLISVTPRKFFSIENFKIFADQVDTKSKQLRDVFVYQMPNENRPPDRIFARTGDVVSDPNQFTLTLHNGQLERFELDNPPNFIHTTFHTYAISVPLNFAKNSSSVRYRNIPSDELKTLIQELKAKGFSTNPLEAEYSLRYAVAFAPFCLALTALPLATVLRRGGRSFGFGVTIIMIFTYYLFLILGLTLAEKGILPPHPALWIGNIISLLIGFILLRRMART